MGRNWFDRAPAQAEASRACGMWSSQWRPTQRDPPRNFVEVGRMGSCFQVNEPGVPRTIDRIERWIIMSFRRTSRGLTLAGIAPILVSALIPGTSAISRASDGQWVTADGKRISLTKSNRELAVQLRDVSDQDACAKRLAENNDGALESFKLSPHARVKLLKTPLTTSLRRDRIRQDPSVMDVRPIYRFAGEDQPVIATGTIVVKVGRGLAEKERQQLWGDFGVAAAAPVHGQPGVYLLTAADGQDEILLAEAIADDRRVAWSQPNFRREMRENQLTISDQYYELQWHLNNTGQLGGTSGADIDAPEAWAIATGENVLFGMFDDCVDIAHEDLAENYIGIGQDVTLTTTDAGYNDPSPKQFEDRHGTSVMGLAVARANARGGRGVAYNAKFTASRGLEELASDSQTASAYVFARDENVDVHINSWGFPGRFPDPAIIVDAIQVAYATGRNKGDLDGDGIDDPLGMVILFASGNEASQNAEGFDLSALPQVISVGASNDDDGRSLYSNYGNSLALLAPSDDFTFFSNAGIFTTDNSDAANAADTGYNRGGVNVEYFLLETDPNGNYTEFFGGTSAACPIAAGVAGLILSVNPNLTATDVRMLMEHTTDPIGGNLAAYDPITGHSLTYGYGRINAGGAGDAKLGAVEAAQQTLTNGGITWPDRPADVVVTNTGVTWKQNPGTDEFLVIQSDDPFEFVPVDGECYDGGQGGCVSGALRSLPAGVTALAVGCGLTCDGTEGTCGTGEEQCVLLPQGAKSLAIYARNSLGRYSFGVALDSAGNVNGSGTFIDLAASGDVIIPTGPPATRPSVTISVSPLEGTSPLTVSFTGNALSTVAIDENRTTWDFDINQPPDVDAATRNATHIYEVADGETRTFIARLTMYDTNGTPGSEEVAIRVAGQGFDPTDDGLSGSSLQIIVGLPGTPDANVSTGISPFEVLLSVDASQLPGTLQAINWDLGDGTTATSLVVPHTYSNDGATDLRIPITATVTASTSQTTTINTTATRIITVKPGLPPVDGGGAGACEIPGTCASGPGGRANACGAGAALLPVLFMGLTLLRLRRSLR